MRAWLSRNWKGFLPNNFLDFENDWRKSWRDSSEKEETPVFWLEKSRRREKTVLELCTTQSTIEFMKNLLANPSLDFHVIHSVKRNRRIKKHWLILWIQNSLKLEVLEFLINFYFSSYSEIAYSSMYVENWAWF